ncbi:diguanylate cyclase [Leptolyngbya sp. AN02str]|uniref:response regulator n=1 Tax=Leptolyngbya sp. AN02str TaxID=3423363 RepID=UPI003D31823E
MNLPKYPSNPTVSDLQPNSESAVILVVDDSATNRSILADILIEAGFQVGLATNGEQALRHLKHHPTDLILLDVMMQGMSGFETCERMKADSNTQDIPIIFITGIDDTESKIKGLSLGAVDYITKPFSPKEAIARISTHLQLGQFAKTLEEQNQKLRAEVEQRENAEAMLRLLNAELRRERDLARVTLNAIGDAVITTDAKGCIQTLNPVAETLTGWHTHEALARPLHEVFKVFDEDSGNAVPNLVEQVLQQGTSITSAGEHRLLMSYDGATFAIHETASPICAAEGDIVGVVLVFRDVTPMRQMVKQLAWQATYDPLTQLINRREFEMRLDAAIASAQYQQELHSLCFVDLDEFKHVNDTSGHAAGDEVLRQVSTVLKNSVRKTDLVARLGGDEFAVILYNCGLEQARWIAQTLCQNVENHSFTYQDQVFQLGASVGLVEITAEPIEASRLLSMADTACYTAKKQGGHRVSYSKRVLEETGESAS